MNPYLKNLNRVEFIITYSCTGKCKHCSESTLRNMGGNLNADAAVRALEQINAAFHLQSVMTFGGEPLLFPNTVVAIHSAAQKLNIPKRQLITNGYFSKDREILERVAKAVAESGVNDILVSVDAFHQETIPLKDVIFFTESLTKNGANTVRVHPAWLINKDDDNPYNLKTREIIKHFEPLGVLPSNGNVIFPAGNALKYLGKYFNKDTTYTNRYEQDPKNIRSVCIEPNGNCLNCNICNENFLNNLNNYSPLI